ncbi:MAG: histidine ammonia-lyase [Chloroflexi bacterium]|nr:histidine ammonia-lyase [Chloroflexota bacterium]
MSIIDLTGFDLTIADVVAVARHGARVAPLGDSVVERMTASANWVKSTILQHDEPIYGVNTGFGPLARERVAPALARKLSRNLILNCLAGVGDPLPREIVRAMMLIRVNVLARGHSGARPVLAQTLIDMLNAGVTPVVPAKGSLGASGDLAPLAHIAVVLTCDEDGGGYSGEAWFGDERMTGAEAMARAGLARLVPEAKEGLALTNGTGFMAAAATLAIHDAASLLQHAEIAAALTLEALLALDEPFRPELHAAANQPGQQQVAADLRALYAGSRLINAQPERVQDAYSLRCIPQVLGPVRDLLGFLRGRVSDTLNASLDNPLLFDGPDGMHKQTGGNFHGQGLSIWLNCLGMSIAAAGSIAERRVFRTLTPELNAGLPAMLVPASGIDSGLMIPQYTAAALVSDNKTLAHPDCVDSIPSSGNQEDFVSMGANAARHCLEILGNVRRIIAIELLTAAQAVDLRTDGPARLGRGSAIAYRLVRERVRFLPHDRETSPDIESLAALIHDGTLAQAVSETLEEAWTW